MHGEEGDALLVIHIAEHVAQAVVGIAILRVGDDHHSLHLLGVAYGTSHVDEEVVLAHHFLFGRVGGDDKLAQFLVLEGLGIQVFLVVGRSEVLHCHRLLVMDEHHLRLVLTLTKSTV